MARYEYRVVPAPTKAGRIKGVKGTEARFAAALASLMNELGADGWEYQRSDTLPCEERQGLTGRTTVFRNMLVFRRPLEVETVEAAPVAAAPIATEKTQPVLAAPLFRATAAPTAAAPEGRPPALSAVKPPEGAEPEAAPLGPAAAPAANAPAAPSVSGNAPS